MTLHLYDTATRSVREFVPLIPGQASVYLCGVTVQGGPHIGHLRSGVNYDVLRRWLEYRGLRVTFIRNITDIDDKVLAKSCEAGQPYWAIAYANELILSEAYRALNVVPPSYEPRATGHVPQMHELIAKLIDADHAYPATDGSGDVYFDVRSDPAYGTLSGQRVDAMESATEEPTRGKRDPHDFALWKGAKPGEPTDAVWPSPWGPGRPGWHIECSAMCHRYLGAEFVIDGGGLDLVFPHHENEWAQSRSAGYGFARYWVHHGLLNLGSGKMSKSLGNVIDMAAVRRLGIRPVELRYYLLAPHYRSVIDFSESALAEAATAYQRMENFVVRAAQRANHGDHDGVARDHNSPMPTDRSVHATSDTPGDPGTPGDVVPTDFVAAMDDDLNTSRALAVVHDLVREANPALADGQDVTGPLAAVRAMLGLLGIDPLDPHWAGGTPSGELRSTVDALVALALDQRERARARRDWAAADGVRDQLKQAGVFIEDTPHGPRWSVADAR